MEASTIEVEPVQKKGLKPKQLVRIVSNKYGKNDTHWKKKQDAKSNEEYCNDSKDFQYHETQPTIQEEINPTKIQNITTTPELEPKSSNLETKLSEEQSIQTQEPLDLDQVSKKINFLELEMRTNTASTDSYDSQKNPFSHLSPNSGLKSAIYVRIGWEEYLVMAFLDQNLEYNSIPLKQAAAIGTRQISKELKSQNKKFNKKIMNRAQVILPTNKTLYLRLMVKGNSNHIVLGKDFCYYFNWLHLFNSISSSYEE
ncbi:hypothetical protein O181_095743 [Austropuccinia psidii MF-1]|uniref:Uncharacterized protein n=1 Tax=Austropuccinia psidii MF-1 TaxID=1389203 RepID=A0A9Q3J4F2_9BASI|nr:hypothetical protein [Austropuccinia psidii MF-1]